MKLNKNKKLLLVAISAFLVMIISTVSYAYFTASVAGNNSAQATVIQTGHMQVTYAEGDIVGITTNMLPGNYIEKSFTVVNTGTVDTTYSIYLNDVENTFVTKSDLVYELITEDGRVVAQTTCPDSNSKIATDINLPVNATHHYTLRITFKETGLNQDDNKGKKFKSKIGLVEEEVTYAYTILSGDLNTVGSVVKIANEEFYVIGQEDSTHVRLLSKWNLKVGNILDGNSWSKTGEYTSSDTGYGLQSSDAKGDVDGASTFNGIVTFSSTNYWSSTVSTYPAWVYTNAKESGTYKASIAEYVDNYVTYLTQQGVSVTGRLIKQEELVTLGCNASTYYCDSTGSHGGTAPSWVYQTSYWTGSALSGNDVWGVGSFGAFVYSDYYSVGPFGVRPVIILEK